MGLFDRLFRSGPTLDTKTVEGALLQPYVNSRVPWRWPPPKVEAFDGGEAILAQSPEIKARLVVLASAILAEDRQGDSAALALKSLISRLLRSKLPFTEADLVELLRHFASRGAWNWELPVGSLVGAVERHLDGRAMTTALEQPLRQLQAKGSDRVSSAVQRRIHRLLQDDGGQLEPDAWGRRVTSALSALPPELARSWRVLLDHAGATAGKTRPTKTWQKQAVSKVEALGTEAAENAIGEWIDGLVPGPADEGPATISDANVEILRGLLWAVAPTADRLLVARLGQLAETSFRKVRWHGPRSPRLGSGCLIALGMVPGHDGIAELTRIEGKTRYETARRLISTTLERCALDAGLDRTDLEELAIPDYGLDAEGRLVLPVGDGEAELKVEGDDVLVRWHRTGKTTKSAPKALREAEPDAIKRVRETVQQLRATLSGQAGRIERHYLADRALPASTWRERYLDHPLVATLTRRLFWSLEAADRARTIGWRDGAMRDLDGGDVTDDLDTAHRVRLWHPVRSSVDEVRRLRRQITEVRVTQPFKQVYREVYLLTDAERATGTYSNRFAAHILRQHQVQALCQQRGWKYDLQGDFDSFNVPFRSLPAFDLTVEFWVEPVPEQTTEMEIYLYLTTDQVCFLRHDARLTLGDVPALAFSEALRDVDLFTSVASVGNDPTWRDRGEQPEAWVDYWTDFAFGGLNATAETRREVLQGLLPHLKIADRCALDERWLVVRGDLRTYKIHLRSGHIMMDPNQQYLCIVPDRSAKRTTSTIYLPFEGDTVLSMILSKAFLLADDAEIADSTIVSQING